MGEGPEKGGGEMSPWGQLTGGFAFVSLSGVLFLWSFLGLSAHCPLPRKVPLTTLPIPDPLQLLSHLVLSPHLASC